MRFGFLSLTKCVKNDKIYVLYYAVMFKKGGKHCMKQKYIQPDIELIKLTSEDILEASENEVFVDTEDLFN